MIWSVIWAAIASVELDGDSACGLDCELDGCSGRADLTC